MSHRYQYPDVRGNAKPMSFDELQGHVGRMIDSATNYIDSEVSPRRAKATKYYDGDLPDLPKIEGRSQVVLTPVRDTVLAALPPLLRVFLGAERAVEYEPRRPDAVEGAEQATDYVYEVVCRQDNNIFREAYAAFKDALVRRTGIIKWWWDDSAQIRPVRAEGVHEDQIEALVMDPRVTVNRVEQDGEITLPMPAGPNGEMAPVPVPTYTVEFTQINRFGVARFAALPTEEMLINRDARSRDEADFLAHRTEKTRGELISMGVDPAVIDEHGGPSNTLRTNVERQARQRNTIESRMETDRAGERVLWVEAWPKIDWDGDGVAELRKVCTIGPGYFPVLNIPIAERPLALLTPDIEPHTWEGRDLADRTLDLQKMTSAIARSMNDSLALAVNPRLGYVEGQVNKDDIQNTALGAPIGQEAPGMVQPFIWPFVGRDALEVLGFYDKVKTDRVGQMPTTLDPNALQSSTRPGVTAVIEAANQQIELIARVFAETGWRDLFRGLLRLLHEHQDGERIVLLRGKFVPVNPRSWDAEMDVKVNVAFGSGLVEQRLAVLAATAEDQWRALEKFGLANPFTTLGQYRATRAKMLQLQGFQDVDRYYMPLPLDWQPPPPTEPPQPDPATLLAQAEIARVQAETARKEADIAIAQTEAAIKREEMRLRDDLERDKLAADTWIKVKDMELRYKTAIDTTELKAEIDRERREESPGEET